MTIKVWHYAGCSTCKRALRFLDEKGVSYEAIPIVERPPSKAVLRALIEKSGLPVRKFLNTSGQSYRALVADLGRDAVAALDDEALIAKLAADGKMIKRPLVDAGARVLVGFDEQAYGEAFAR